MGRENAVMVAPEAIEETVLQQDVEARLRRLQDRHGRITPRSVVDDARNPESPLHGFFEWDDSKAAEAYRLDQARALIRGCPVVVTHETVTIRPQAYLRDPDRAANEQGYVSFARIMSSDERRHAAMQAECDRVRSMVARARRIAMVCGLGEEFNAFLTALAVEYRIDSESAA